MRCVQIGGRLFNAYDVKHEHTAVVRRVTVSRHETCTKACNMAGGGWTVWVMATAGFGGGVTGS